MLILFFDFDSKILHKAILTQRCHVVVVELKANRFLVLIERR